MIYVFRYFVKTFAALRLCFSLRRCLHYVLTLWFDLHIPTKNTKKNYEGFSQPSLTPADLIVSNYE